MSENPNEQNEVIETEATPQKEVEKTVIMEAIPESENPLVGMTADEKNWCMFCHASALFQFFGIPMFLGPLIIWLVKKDEMAIVDKHGKEALNFQLSFTIYFIICSIVIVIGWLAAIPLGICWLIFTIIGSVKASNGELYHYPMTIRFLK